MEGAVDIIKLYAGIQKAITDSLQNDGLRLRRNGTHVHAAVIYLASKTAADIANRIDGIVGLSKMVEESIRSVVGPSHTYGGDRENMSHDTRPWPEIHTDSK